VLAAAENVFGAKWPLQSPRLATDGSEIAPADQFPVGQALAHKHSQRTARDSEIIEAEGNSMNGKTQAIVSAAILALLGWIVAEQRSLSGDLTKFRTGVHGDIADLRERMARLEGLFEGFTQRKETP